jgi:hypothetical protein
VPASSLSRDITLLRQAYATATCGFLQHLLICVVESGASVSDCSRAFELWVVDAVCAVKELVAYLRRARAAKRSPRRIDIKAAERSLRGDNCNGGSQLLLSATKNIVQLQDNGLQTTTGHHASLSSQTTEMRAPPFTSDPPSEWVMTPSDWLMLPASDASFFHDLSIDTLLLNETFPDSLPPLLCQSPPCATFCLESRLPMDRSKGDILASPTGVNCS